RCHAAEGAVRREHEARLAEWARAGLRLVGWGVTAETLQGLVGLTLAAGLVFLHLASGGEPAATLLLAWWAVGVPLLGAELASVARQWPGQRNVVLRLLEPLSAPEEEQPAQAPGQTAEGATPTGGVDVELQGVTVLAGGQAILRGVDLHLR